MEVILILSEAASEAVRHASGGGPDTEKIVSEIERAVGESGRSLAPVHAHTSDAKLSRYFKLDVKDRETAEKIIESVRDLPAVESAYWKPAEEAP